MAAKYGKKAQDKVEKAMHERKHGTLRSGSSGKKVKSRKQTIAIGLSEARREGGKVPAKKSSKKATSKKSSSKKSSSKKSTKKSTKKSAKKSSKKSSKKLSRGNSSAARSLRSAPRWRGRSSASSRREKSSPSTAA